VYTVTVVSVRRSEWLGHGVRMNGKTTVTKLLESQRLRRRK